MSLEIPTTIEQEKPLVWVDEARLREVALTVIEAYQSRQGLFDPKVWGREIRPPEEPFVQLVKEYAKEIDNYRYPLHAVFFMTMIMFADNSSNLLSRLADDPLSQEKEASFQLEMFTLAELLLFGNTHGYFNPKK